MIYPLKNHNISSYFKEVASKKGKKDFVVPNKNSKNTYNLRLLSPAIDDGLPKPLILALHWSGGNTDYQIFSDCLIEPAFLSLNAYIIVPDAEQQIWYTPHNQQKVLELMEAAMAIWNVDKNKVLVTGFSNGGNGSWYYAEHHADLFKVAIPMASSYKVSGKVEIPVYLIHGEQDDLFPVAATLNFAKIAQEAGTDISIVTNKNLSHFEACAYAADLKAALPWLERKWRK